MTALQKSIISSPVTTVHTGCVRRVSQQLGACECLCYSSYAVAPIRYIIGVSKHLVGGFLCYHQPLSDRG